MNVLIKPIITEKASLNSERYNCYSFVVDKRANKIEIKTAIEDAYGVTVEQVRTLNVGPKRSVRYTKAGLLPGKKSGYKKAVVQVAEGDEIDFFSNI